MTEQQACPKCGYALTVNEGFVTWCPECEWNLDADKEEKSASLLRTIFGRFQEARGESLKEYAKTHAFKSSGRFFHRTLLIMICLGVDVLGVFLFLLGIGFVVLAYYNPFALLVALVLLGGSWSARPRLGAMPERVLDREKHQHLYALADHICDSMKADRIDAIVVDEQFNTMIGQVGWRRKRVLILGLPMLDILSPQELVVLIGHEMAHTVNGDPLRGLIVSTAVNSLLEWHVVLLPDRLTEPGAGLVNAGIAPFRLIMAAFASIMKLFAYLVMYLAFRSNQVAEYRADLIAAWIGGREAMVGLLRKLSHHVTVDMVVHRHVLRPDGERSLWDSIRKRIDSLPPEEIDRRNRLEKLGRLQFGELHPPTVDRIDVVRARASATREVTLSEEELTEIKSELSDLYDWAEEKIKDSYLNTLYH